MKRIKVSGIFLVLFLLSCNNQLSQKERKFSFIYHIQLLPITEPNKHIELWVPLPQDNQHQSIMNLYIESPFHYSLHTEHEYGNLMAYISTISPFPSGFSLTVSFDVIRKEHSSTSYEITVNEAEKYLSPFSYVPRDIRFTEIVQTVIRGSNPVIKNGRALYDHILERMEYDKSGEGWGKGDAIYACDVGKGNCTDYHSLFNAVARTANIPARFLIGFPVQRKKAGTLSGYHCWSEFYDYDIGWIPVDISEADKHPEKREYFFGNLDPDRVMFTMGRDITLVPQSQNGPVNFFIYPVLEINGERSKNYNKSFSFRSIER